MKLSREILLMQSQS